MRIFGIFLLSLAAVLVALTTADSQQPRRGGGRGAGFGGQGTNSITLVQNPAVQKELNITEEQLKKLPDAVQKALAEVLDAKQVARLKQINLQQRGATALFDPAVAAQLKISDSQKEQIKTVMAESRKEMAELFKQGRGRESFEKMATLRKESQEKVEKVLSDEQRKAYKEMLGEEFKLQSPFQRGGRPDGERKGRGRRPKSA